MNTSNLSFKAISTILSIMILMQSCSVYDKTPVTLETAVTYPRPVKVVSNNSKNYKFKSLEQKEDQIYGVARRNSKTSRILYAQIIENKIDRRYVKILLKDEQVNNIYHKDKFTSTVVTILVVIATLGVLNALSPKEEKCLASEGCWEWTW